MRHVAAVSLGAVFLGAMTYIGNGPNFMVKAIAEQSGVKMPKGRLREAQEAFKAVFEARGEHYVARDPETAVRDLWALYDEQIKPEQRTMRRCWGITLRLGSTRLKVRFI